MINVESDILWSSSKLLDKIARACESFPELSDCVDFNTNRRICAPINFTLPDSTILRFQKELNTTQMFRQMHGPGPWWSQQVYQFSDKKYKYPPICKQTEYMLHQSLHVLQIQNTPLLYNVHKTCLPARTGNSEPLCELPMQRHQQTSPFISHC